MRMFPSADASAGPARTWRPVMSAVNWQSRRVASAASDDVHGLYRTSRHIFNLFEDQPVLARQRDEDRSNEVTPATRRMSATSLHERLDPRRHIPGMGQRWVIGIEQNGVLQWPPRPCRPAPRSQAPAPAGPMRPGIPERARDPSRFAGGARSRTRLARWIAGSRAAWVSTGLSSLDTEQRPRPR